MTTPSSRSTLWTVIPPWMVLGSAAILAGILLFLAFKNANREREFMEGALLSEGRLLIRSIEAGSRTGMMGMGWGQGQIQVLLEETAHQPDILYAALVDPSGKIVAHSKPDMVGETLSLTLPRADETLHSFSTGDRGAFEVVRSFQPWLRHRGGGRGEGRRFRENRDCRRDLYIVVGLDPTPFDDARRQDLHQTALLFGMMFAVGAAGFFSLGLAQHYRSARRSLQDMRAFTTTLVNRMPVGLLAVDGDGRVQRTNEAAQSILGKDAPLPQNLAEYPCFLPILERIGQAETVVEQEILCRTSEGGSIPLLVNAASLPGGPDNAAGYVFLFSDLTRIKALEEQLRRSERLASLGRLAAGIAHEIRNPLSSIKGFAAILAGRRGGDERSREISDVMIQEVERLNRVISELLDYARPTELHRKSCALEGIIGRTLQLVEKEAAERNVGIAHQVEPEGLEAEIDPDRFAQILLNLYLNAIQAMDDGGDLRVEAFEDGTHLLVRVGDSGPGIPPEHLPHIFDPYFTTRPSGVGLGLANVHKLVEAHGGEIGVENRAGGGTVFTVSVPASGSLGFVARSGSVPAPVPSIVRNTTRRDHAPGGKQCKLRRTVDMTDREAPLILVVDDDRAHRLMLMTLLEEWGYRVEDADGGQKAFDSVRNRPVDLILMDMRMPRMDGIEATRLIHGYNPAIPILIMTAYSSVATAVEALKSGAYDYLTKPVDFDALKLALARALEHTRLREENESLRRQLACLQVSDMIGRSPRMQRVAETIALVAPTDATVLITGESGTGKGLAARAIHANSSRRNKPLVEVNCAAIPETLMESELFGHEKGAFTGADKQRRGRFSMADGGTILLDEIGDLALTTQAKLLRVLQESEIQRVGSDACLRVDVRVLAATNRKIDKMVSEGTFREDLYYRLNVVTLEMPPLRERIEDIPALAEHFRNRFAEKHRKKVSGITPRAMDSLLRYSWPGNIRELENALERAVILLRNPFITERELPAAIAGIRESGESCAPAPPPPSVAAEASSLAEAERRLIFQVLQESGGNKSEAARRLGITRRTIKLKLRKYLETDDRS